MNPTPFWQGKDFFYTIVAIALTTYLLVTHQITATQASVFMGAIIAVLRGSAAIDNHAASTVHAARIRAGLVVSPPPPAAVPPLQS